MTAITTTDFVVKTAHTYYLTVLGIGNVEWVSLRPIQVVNRAPLLPGGSRGGALFLTFPAPTGPVPLCVVWFVASSSSKPATVG